MKLRGEYVLRELAGDYVAVPVGEAARRFSGIIGLNEVSAEIWCCLERGMDRADILTRLLDQFETEPERAAGDLEEFLNAMQARGFLEP